MTHWLNQRLGQHNHLNLLKPIYAVNTSERFCVCSVQCPIDLPHSSLPPQQLLNHAIVPQQILTHRSYSPVVDQLAGTESKVLEGYIMQLPLPSLKSITRKEHNSCIVPEDTTKKNTKHPRITEEQGRELLG